jgi:guanosine-3',5'-bis(diphosphate) 3'-pyrophosphohydrolase
MTPPADPAHATPAIAPDAVPDYVRALEQAAAYLPEDQRATLRRAWAIGAAAHAGQSRRSGEPYITHPVAVAAALAEQHVDVETLVAAILHDTLEDTPLSRESIAGEFGETVADLVDGVTKLDKLTPRASARCCWRWRATCA